MKGKKIRIHLVMNQMTYAPLYLAIDYFTNPLRLYQNLCHHFVTSKGNKDELKSSSISAQFYNFIFRYEKTIKFNLEKGIKYIVGELTKIETQCNENREKLESAKNNQFEQDQNSNRNKKTTDEPICSLCQSNGLKNSIFETISTFLNEKIYATWYSEIGCKECISKYKRILYDSYDEAGFYNYVNIGIIDQVCVENVNGDNIKSRIFTKTTESSYNKDYYKNDKLLTEYFFDTLSKPSVNRINHLLLTGDRDIINFQLDNKIYNAGKDSLRDLLLKIKTETSESLSEKEKLRRILIKIREGDKTLIDQLKLDAPILLWHILLERLPAYVTTSLSNKKDLSISDFHRGDVRDQPVIGFHKDTTLQHYANKFLNKVEKIILPNNLQEIKNYKTGEFRTIDIKALANAKKLSHIERELGYLIDEFFEVNENLIAPQIESNPRLEAESDSEEYKHYIDVLNKVYKKSKESNLIEKLKKRNELDEKDDDIKILSNEIQNLEKKIETDLIELQDIFTTTITLWKSLSQSSPSDRDRHERAVYYFWTTIIRKAYLEQNDQAPFPLINPENKISDLSTYLKSNNGINYGLTTTIKSTALYDMDKIAPPIAAIPFSCIFSHSNLFHNENKIVREFLNRFFVPQLTMEALRLYDFNSYNHIFKPSRPEDNLSWTGIASIINRFVSGTIPLRLDKDNHIILENSDDYSLEELELVKKNLLHHAIYRIWNCDLITFLHNQDLETNDLEIRDLINIKGLARSKTLEFEKELDEKEQRRIENSLLKTSLRASSHNINSHCSIRSTNKELKKRIRDLYSIDKSELENEDIIKWLDHTNERMSLYEIARNEFINDPLIPAKTYKFYEDIILPFCELNSIMDNIARGENACYSNSANNGLKIKVFVGPQELSCIYPAIKNYSTNADCSYPDSFPYLYKTRDKDSSIHTALSTKYPIDNDFSISLGSPHFLYSILENFIRNSAKNNDRVIKRNGRLEVKLHVQLDHDEEYHHLDILDNVSMFSPAQLKDFKGKHIDSNIDHYRQGMGIKDMKINAHRLAYRSPIDDEKFKESLKLIYKDGKQIKLFDNRQIETMKNNKYLWGYRIKLAKPKELALIGINLQK